MMTSPGFEHVPSKIRADDFRWNVRAPLQNTYLECLQLSRFSSYISTTDAFCALSERRSL